MGAGFIFYIKNPLVIFTLYKCTKNGTGFDVPKGSTEKGETPLQTALRESFEECGIVPEVHSIVHSITLNKGKLTLYLAPYEQHWKPFIQPNPITGKIEHLHFQWCTPKEFEAGCVKHLKGLGLTLQALENEGVI